MVEPGHLGAGAYVEHARRAVTAAGRDPAAVRAEGDRFDLAAVVEENSRRFQTGQPVIQLSAAAQRTERDAIPVRAHRHGLDLARRVDIRCLRAGVRVEGDGRDPRAGKDRTPVGAEGNEGHRSVPEMPGPLPAGAGIKHLCHAIVAAYRDPGTVRAERHRHDPGVAVVPGQHRAGGGLEHQRVAVVGAGHHPAAVRAERHRPDRAAGLDPGQLRSRDHVEQQHRAVLAAGCDPAAVRAERHRVHLAAGVEPGQCARMQPEDTARGQVARQRRLEQQ